MTFIVFAKQIAAFSPAMGSALVIGGVDLKTIAWPWYVLIGTSITMLVGILASFTHSPPVPRSLEATT